MTNAQTWIGSSAAGDKLDLDAITTALPADAAQLRSFLANARVTGLLKMRREASAAAAAAQKKFKRLSAAAVLGTAIATLSSGLLLYSAGSDGQQQQSPAAAPSAAAQLAPSGAGPESLGCRLWCGA